MTDKTEPHAWLIPIAGPTIEPLELIPRSEGLTIGRHEQCDLHLPTDAHQVSRFHARLIFDSGTWWLSDLKSRWGTVLNGCTVPAAPPLPLNDGDLVRITPWTFTFSLGGPDAAPVRCVDDTGEGETMVRTLTGSPRRALVEDRLALLLESTASIHAARSEHELAERVLDVACRGTGLQNAALLRPLDAAGGIEIIASRMQAASSRRHEPAPDAPTYSRSLLAAASQGVVAELTGPGTGAISQSIVQMNIRSAICVPLMLEGDGAPPLDAQGRGGQQSLREASTGIARAPATGATVAAFLYLDSRGDDAPGLAPEDAAFCVTLGRIAGLALANLKRIDIERRQAAILAEISAAATAQRWILPRRETRIGPLLCIGESRPGEFMGGDFFDIVPLDDGRTAVALGDVTGHGISASVLMTTAQGFLHSALHDHADPARAVYELNRFIEPRTPAGKFITLWIGIFDLDRAELTYVDAGHGYALLIDPGRNHQRLSGGDGLPVGLFDTAQYVNQRHALRPEECTLIVSDGIVEQPAGPSGRSGQESGASQQDDGSDQFGMRGIERVLRRPLGPEEDEVAALFDAVTRHAGQQQLADDATAVLIRW